jgi:beta-lactamase class A/beta-lactamase class A CARB-5
VASSTGKIELKTRCAARRDVLRLFGATLLVVSSIGEADAHDYTLIAQVTQEIETRLQARIGVAIGAIGDDTPWNWRGDERFALTSTFKPIAAAAVLRKCDCGEERLDRRIAFATDDIVAYSPVTEKRIGEPGMTLGELCEAAIDLSDNTAANLILDAIGGTDALTGFFRSVGDKTSRLDRKEPELNSAIPRDLRDTTTPIAITATLERLLFGDPLSSASRRRLMAWMEADRVGDALLRAGLPKTWKIADKTGAGGNGARAIVACATPPSGRPLMISVFVAETRANLAECNSAIAEIGAAVGKAYKG